MAKHYKYFIFVCFYTCVESQSKVGLYDLTVLFCFCSHIEMVIWDICASYIYKTYNNIWLLISSLILCMYVFSEQKF